MSRTISTTRWWFLVSFVVLCSPVTSILMAWPTKIHPMMSRMAADPGELAGVCAGFTDEAAGCVGPVFDPNWAPVDVMQRVRERKSYENGNSICEGSFDEDALRSPFETPEAMTGVGDLLCSEPHASLYPLR